MIDGHDKKQYDSWIIQRSRLIATLFNSLEYQVSIE